MDCFTINVFDEIDEISLESVETWTTYDNLEDAIDNAKKALRKYDEEHLIIATVFLDDNDENIDLYAISNLNEEETTKIRRNNHYTVLNVDEYLK